MADGYSDDFYGWAMAQADVLRRRSANEIDWENLAEEIESLGKSEARELRSHLLILCAHLLKWMFQPERRGASWELTIKAQRDEADDVLAENPSLKPRLDDIYASAYRRARTEAALQTEMPLDTFPVEPPFTVEQARDSAFWPDATV